MKIMVVADSHTVKGEHIEQIKNMETDSCEELVFLGDIQRPLIDIFCSHFPNQFKVGVLGNHDQFGLLTGSGVDNIHQKTVEHERISFFGFEGSLRYKKSHYPLYEQEEVFEAFADLGQVDVLITHNSPFGVNERAERPPEGFVGVTEYLHARNPVYHLHGHQHVNNITVLANRTTVIGVYGVILLDLLSGEVEQLIVWE